jgi:hypothetical protein
MRMFITLIATLVLAGITGLWLPFWSLALAAMLVGFVVHPGAWSAFLAGVLLWGGLAYGADVANTGILSARVGALFGTTGMGMVLITAAMGGLLAGLGAALGDRLHKAFNP